MRTSEDSFGKTVATYAIIAAVTLVIFGGIPMALYYAFPKHPLSERVTKAIVDWKIKRLRAALLSANPGANLAGFGYCANGTRIYELDLSGSTISDISPLQSLPLSRLSLNGSRVSDLSPLAAMHSLMTLDVAGTPITSLEPLRGLPLLLSLDISGTAVADLSPLVGGHFIHLNITGTPAEGKPLPQGLVIHPLYI